MCTIPFVGWIANAAARLVGPHGAVTEQAQKSGCSRQSVYDHARKGESGCRRRTWFSRNGGSIGRLAIRAYRLTLPAHIFKMLDAIFFGGICFVNLYDVHGLVFLKCCNNRIGQPVCHVNK